MRNYKPLEPRDRHEQQLMQAKYSQGFYDATLACLVFLLVCVSATIGVLYFMSNKLPWAALSHFV